MALNTVMLNVYAECLCVVTSPIILSVVMLSVLMLSVVMLGVVAPVNVADLLTNALA
jgi:hypothetical protein